MEVEGAWWRVDAGMKVEALVDGDGSSGWNLENFGGVGLVCVLVRGGRRTVLEWRREVERVGPRHRRTR